MFALSIIIIIIVIIMSGIWIGEVELQIPPDRCPLHHPHYQNPQVQHQQQNQTNQHHDSRRHPESDQHPQIQDLPMPSDGTPTTAPTSNVAAGSPKTAFSAGLPSRIASDSLKQPFSLHSLIEGLSEEEQRVLKHHDIRQILTSIQLLGYEPVSTSEVFNGPGVAFFHTRSDNITRLYVLIQTLHVELNRLMPMLYANGRDFGEGLDGGRWKEKVVTRLLADIVPALGGVG